jgi:hypothetical protein
MGHRLWQDSTNITAIGLNLSSFGSGCLISSSQVPENLLQCGLLSSFPSLPKILGKHTAMRLCFLEILRFWFHRFEGELSPPYAKFQKHCFSLPGSPGSHRWGVCVCVCACVCKRVRERERERERALLRVSLGSSGHPCEGEQLGVAQQVTNRFHPHLALSSWLLLLPCPHALWLQWSWATVLTRFRSLEVLLKKFLILTPVLRHLHCLRHKIL